MARNKLKHNKPKNSKKRKINLVFFQLQQRVLFAELITQNLSLISQNLYLAELIFKIDSLNLFSTKPLFCYREILKFRDLFDCHYSKYIKQIYFRCPLYCWNLRIFRTTFPFKALPEKYLQWSFKSATFVLEDIFQSFRCSFFKNPPGKYLRRSLVELWAVDSCPVFY